MMTQYAQDNDGEMKAVQEWRADHDKPMTCPTQTANLIVGPLANISQLSPT